MSATWTSSERSTRFLARYLTSSAMSAAAMGGGAGSGGRSGGALLAVDQAVQRAAGQRADLDPAVEALAVELEDLGPRIVGAEQLDELAIARAALVGRNDAVERALLRALPGETEDDRHWESSKFGPCIESGAIYPLPSGSV